MLSKQNFVAIVERVSVDRGTMEGVGVCMYLACKLAACNFKLLLLRVVVVCGLASRLPPFTCFLARALALLYHLFSFVSFLSSWPPGFSARKSEVIPTDRRPGRQRIEILQELLS